MNTTHALQKEGESTLHPAPWGRALIVTSCLATVVCAAVPIYTLRFVTFPVVQTAVWLPLLVPLLALAFIVRGYTITQDSVLIHRLWWDTVISRESIREVIDQPNAMVSSIRTCGNGGMFSFTGWYWSQALGFYKAYVTDFNRTVIIHKKVGAAVISPADPTAFVNDYYRN